MYTVFYKIDLGETSARPNNTESKLDIQPLNGNEIERPGYDTSSHPNYQAKKKNNKKKNNKKTKQ